MDTDTIQIVGKDLFPQRMGIEKEFGELLYDQVIFVLENIAKENPNAKTYHNGIRLGVYLDTPNQGQRIFEIDVEKADKFHELFGQIFYKRLKEYNNRQQKIGTDVLFQLNKGNISMNDFSTKF